MTDIFDIYLLEADRVNGILLGGLLALLALGLNLIFGVIDVTWICYAELVMIGMYGMYYLVQVFGLPYYVAAPFTILLVAGLGALLHYAGRSRRCCQRRRSTSCSPPAACCSCCRASPPSPSASTSATSASGCRCWQFAEMHFSYSRLLVFRRRADRHGAGLSLHDPHLYRHRHPRHLAGPPDHGADGRRHAPHLSHHVGAGRRAGRPRLPACWCCNTTSIPLSGCRSGRSPS